MKKILTVISLCCLCFSMSVSAVNADGSGVKGDIHRNEPTKVMEVQHSMTNKDADKADAISGDLLHATNKEAEKEGLLEKDFKEVKDLLEMSEEEKDLLEKAIGEKDIKGVKELLGKSEEEKDTKGIKEFLKKSNPTEKSTKSPGKGISGDIKGSKGRDIRKGEPGRSFKKPLPRCPHWRQYELNIIGV